MSVNVFVATYKKTGRHLSTVAPFLCCFTSFIWLGYEDSNLGMPESESVAWPNELN